MERAERDELRVFAQRAVANSRPGSWMLQTSNSYRRIGTCPSSMIAGGRGGDGDVLCATTHSRDRQPDLLAPQGVLEYFVAAQPHVVLELLDRLDAAEGARDRLSRLLATACDELDDTGGDYAKKVAEDLRRGLKAAGEEKVP